MSGRESTLPRARFNNCPTTPVLKEVGQGMQIFQDISNFVNGIFGGGRNRQREEFLQRQIEDFTRSRKLDEEQIAWLREEVARKQKYFDEIEKKEQESRARFAEMEKTLQDSIHAAGRQTGLNEGNRSLFDQIRAQQQKNKNFTTGFVDDFTVLGVNRESTFDEIRNAYMGLAKNIHPDRHPEASEAEKQELVRKFQQISDSYNRLNSIYNK